MAHPVRRGLLTLAAAVTGIGLAAIPGAVSAVDTVAAELLDLAYRNLYGGDFVQVLQVTTRSRAGHEMTRRLQVARKQSSQPPKAMVRFLSPPDIRGTSMLAIEHETGYDEIFVFAPALGRIRRVSAAQRFDAFFATDFTYEDLEPKDAADYEVAHLGSDSIGGTSCIRVEARPRAGVESQYDRTVSCVDPLRAVVLRTDYYIGDDLWKILEADPAMVREIDGRYVATEARLRTPTKRTQTSFVTETCMFQVEIPDSLFTAQNLESGNHYEDLMRVTPQERGSGGKSELRDR